MPACRLTALPLASPQMEESRRRHPEWFPVRPVSTTTTVITALSPDLEGHLSQELETFVPGWVAQHDAKRKGFVPFSSTFDAGLTYDGGLLDCCVFVDSRLPVPGGMTTSVEISVYRKAETPKEETPAWKANLESIRNPRPGSRLLPGPALPEPEPERRHHFCWRSFLQRVVPAPGLGQLFKVR